MEGKFDGLIEVSKKNLVPFHFENGILEMFFGNKLHEIEDECYSLIAQKHGMLMGGYIMFHFPLPLQNYGLMNVINQNGVSQTQNIILGTIRQNVDFYIDNYQENSTFKQMRFSFKELDYFIPSTSACNHDVQNSIITFTRTPIEIYSKTFQYQGNSVRLSLRIYSIINQGSKSSSETRSELMLECEETFNIDYFVSLYHLIHDFFSFICNRKNLTLSSSMLVGTTLQKYPGIENDKTIIDERSVYTSQNLFVIDKYKEEFEDDKSIGKTIRFNLLESNFDGLFDLFVESKVSILSVHTSFKYRNLLDLKQCLHITAAFEYYQREFLPEISSESTLSVYEDVKELLQTYADKQTGKKKKKVNSIIKALSPEISLKDKICKVYNGYSEWSNLHSILGEWFGNDISELAEVANEWRNELAHEKHAYDPGYSVVVAVRLIEHINYCIVLRSAGYTDNLIKLIISNILVHPNIEEQL